jgi:hypothetical protein
MARFFSLAECFDHFGAICAHRNFSKSAMSADGRTVVFAVWEDEVQRVGNRVIYETRYRPDMKGKLRGADSEWIANLKWASFHCDSLVRVLVLAAKDLAAEPREILRCHPDDGLIMGIAHFDTRTGAFRAESV